MTSHTLTIHADGEEKPCVLIRLGEIDPRTAAVTVLQALQGIPKPRAPRSDIGTKREKPATAAS